MDALSQQVEQYTGDLNQFILPGTLMDCFENHRLQELRKAATQFSDNEVSWFLHMMNELRGVADRKEDVDLLFDPSMYMFHDPAWDLPPGIKIALPPLNTQVLKIAPTISAFAVIAKREVEALRTLADTYPDDAIIGLASMAAAAYVDAMHGVTDRETAIRYLAINASAKLEDLWATDDSLWVQAGTRTVELADVVPEMKAHILRDQRSFCDAQITESDLTCYSDAEVKRFAFNPDAFLLSGKTKHMALCGLCQEAISSWIEKARMVEDQLKSERGGMLPQA